MNICGENASNGRIYIAPGTLVFQKFICGSLGSVRDCYLLQSWYVEKSSERFEATNISDVINDSDEREDLDSWKIYKCQDDVIDDMSRSENATSVSEQVIL